MKFCSFGVLQRKFTGIFQAYENIKSFIEIKSAVTELSGFLFGGLYLRV